MQLKRRRIAVAAAVAVAAATVPAAGLAGKPVILDHGSFVDGPSASTVCGAVDGTRVETGTFTFRLEANGAFHATEVGKSVFTASSTGKSVEFAHAGVDMGAGTDNGDGTVTFTEHSAGLAVTFKILNGPILKDADGKPLIGAGEIDIVATFDIATGDLISIQETWHGPHPLRDGVDVCGPTVAYLTS
jgi:hypothetical protein